MEDCIYNLQTTSPAILSSIDKIVNKTFRLLPAREEGEDWEKPLETLLLELVGFSSLYPNSELLFSIICKMQGLKESGSEIEFMMYRRTIFELCGLLNKLKQEF